MNDLTETLSDLEAAFHTVKDELWERRVEIQRMKTAVRDALGSTLPLDSWDDMVAEIRRLVALHAPKAEPAPVVTTTLQSRLRAALGNEIAALSGACAAWLNCSMDRMPVMMPGQLLGILEMRTNKPVGVTWNDGRWWVLAHYSDPCEHDSVADRNEAIVRAIEATFRQGATP